MRRTLSLLSLATVYGAEWPWSSRQAAVIGESGKALQRQQALQREQASLEARLRLVGVQLDAISSGSSDCTLPSGDGPVGSLAYSLGVPAETLSTVLLLSALLLAWRKGEGVLHAVSVLAVAAALTLFAAVRRLRRALSTLGVAAVVLNIALVVVLLLATPAQLDGQIVSSALEPPALPTIAINLSDTQRALVWVAIACNTALLVKVGTGPR
tara:strand:+ start:231 stop:866 length:636 start_codon:yes stop_codon:yes gene_type:complete